MQTCYIVGAGEWTARDFAPVPGDLVIAADGGLRALQTSGVRPDLLVGDLDSLGDCPLPADVPLLRFPVRKDDTDTGLALAEGCAAAIAPSPSTAAPGAAPTTSWPTSRAWPPSADGARPCASPAPAYDAFAVTGRRPRPPPGPEGTLVSVFCLGAIAQGVTLTGLSYPLRDASLPPSSPSASPTAARRSPRRRLRAPRHPARAPAPYALGYLCGNFPLAIPLVMRYHEGHFETERMICFMADQRKTLEEMTQTQDPPRRDRKNWVAFVESDAVNFLSLSDIEKMTLDDGEGNKAKLTRRKDGSILRRVHQLQRPVRRAA